LSILAALLAIIIFLLPLAIDFPLLDPDEGLHASIAQEMVERGDWVVPHFLGKPFLDKPILYFWCQALSLKCFGMNEFAVRLPGLFLGFLGCLTTAAVGWRMFGRTAGLVSGIFYATLILPVALAQAAAHDVMLVPCVNLAILLFWESDGAKSWKSSTGFAVAIGIILGIAILAKGLMGVALVGAAYGSYLLVTRQLTLAACYRGAVSLCIAAAIASIWYLAAERRQPGYLHYYFIERHLLGFATATQTHGDAPWWLYLPTLLGGGLPWIGYLPVTIKELFANNPVACPRLSWACWRGWINRIMPTTSVGMPPGQPEVLLWCWLIGCTILLSLAQSKLVTYLWPVFPAVAILAAISWSRLIDGTLSPASKQSLQKNLLMSSFAGPFVLPIAVFVLQKAFDLHFGWHVWAAAILAGLGTLVPLRFLFRESWQALLAASALSTAAQFIVIIGLVLPVVAPLYSEKNLADYFNHPRSRAPYLPKKMYFVEERIASFVFYLDPALRESIAENQFQEIPRPETDSIQKIDLKSDEVIVIPQTRVRRAKEYLNLEGLTFYNAAQYYLIKSTPMKLLPATEDTWFIRTDFSDEEAWKATCAAIREIPSEDKKAFALWAEANAAIGQNAGELRANVDFIDDPDYADIAIDQLLKLVPENIHVTFLFAVDQTTIAHKEHPILVVDLYHVRGRTFRAIPSQVQGIENNLSIANMDWEDFADHVDKDGIFRGFPK
jgi:4-amino-4-deoxy-L-arabinose transferase-like glycosyltransferase